MSRSHVAVTAALLAIASVTAACSDAPPPAPAPAKKTTPTVAPSASAVPVDPVPNVPSTNSSATPPTVPGTTPTTPGTCTVTTGTPSCDTCLQQHCCTQVNACDANADCGAADTCIAQCYQQYASNPSYEQQCEQQCNAQHPQGATTLQALYQCMGTSCTGQCPQ